MLRLEKKLYLWEIQLKNIKLTLLIFEKEADCPIIEKKEHIIKKIIMTIISKSVNKPVNVQYTSYKRRGKTSDNYQNKSFNSSLNKN